ncbi:CU044_5270 family protein [Actinoplanes solisilvae]|uniref:CU044_5270 family protein n=1 Tax=Actinoplanes solisilvae TaxID=2486853 RepID=UPI000FD6D234|nr:CU044_5270 family protein [Actinoplanes solisilvae]
MNDLDLMKGFRDEATPPDPEVLADARAAMFRTETAKPRRRWMRSLLPVGALAVAVAVAVVVTRPREAVQAPPDAEAVQVLRLAAAEARREPVLSARPDQFVYVESQVAWAGSILTDGKTTYQPPVEKHREIWLSVDGSQKGWVRERADRPGDEFNMDVPIDGGVTPAYLTDLPTDPAKMREWLYNGPDNKNPEDRRAWTMIGDTLREQYLAPAAVSAMFEAAATIPGTSVVKQIDLAGRRGIAVSRTDGGLRSDLIFDATTYRFLGEREVAVNDVVPYPKGSVVGWTAQLKVAIVDGAGQRP